MAGLCCFDDQDSEEGLLELDAPRGVVKGALVGMQGWRLGAHHG